MLQLSRSSPSFFLFENGRRNLALVRKKRIGFRLNGASLPSVLDETITLRLQAADSQASIAVVSVPVYAQTDQPMPIEPETSETR